MSNQFFPTLNTSSWSMTRSPQWQTGVQTAVSGDRKRNPLQEKPLWKWTLKKGILQSANGDLQAIQNLFTDMHGQLDWFLWQDPEGESIVDPTVQVNYLGNYYWPVAFTKDAQDFDRFAYELWECGTLSFEQVMLPLATFNAIQQPHGSILSASVSIVTTHVPGTGEVGNAWVSNGIVALLPGGEPTSFLMRSGSAWTSRTDTFSLTITSPLLLTLEFSIANSVLGTASPADQFLIYDVTLDVHYSDGTAATLRPASANVVADVNHQGTVTNAANAIDGNPSTFATITRSSFSPGYSTAPLLQLSQFS